MSSRPDADATPVADTTTEQRRTRRTRGQQRRAVVTRHGLLEAAGEHFAATGYHGTSLREILEACGVTKGALYFHFPSKQALVEALVAETVQRWTEMAAEVRGRGMDPLQALIASFDGVFTLMLTDPIVHGAIRLLNGPGVPSDQAREHYQQAEAFVTTHLCDAAAAGLLRDGTDIPGMAQSIVATVTGHRMICDRTDALDELPGRIRGMWRALLPLIASQDWLDDHHPGATTR
ncbi:ScbR family autoregulator-binding transcription factor [Actinomycetospora sp. CA-101289]|uniref:ScbR family autoregulator-binding transcription factor n=1 Tax=Actinomycetospora sp. CA-101289 TaxID=3239893 RepID=UPI003D98477F